MRAIARTIGGLVRLLGSADRRAALALAYTAVALTVLEYACYPPRVEAWLQGLDPLSPADWRAPSLTAGLVWALGTIAAFGLVPLAIVLVGHRERPSTVGWSGHGFLGHVGVYLLLYLLMLPVVLWAASQPGFQATYPFVSEATQSWEKFLVWELAYLAQFVALEAFFRGYLLFSLERAMGPTAIFVMTVPYCMIHFHKPPHEALGAVGAGIVLGALALRYRSFWGGALLHGLVALTMDGAAAHRSGLF